MNQISDDFKHGTNFTMGYDVIIEPDVVVMDNVRIGHRVTLKSGTRVDSDSIIDDHCITTGACYIGKNVNVRTGAIVSRSTIIEDKCFIGPGVITNHTKRVTHAREDQINSEHLLTYISYASIIGSQASLLAGVYIGPQSIVGGGSVVIKDVEGYGVYVGSPCRRISELPNGYLITEPENAGRMYFSDETLGHLKRYIPNLKLREIQ
jgi:acetyltransferase-like isoleucine patch superfamily enzyme